MDSRLKNQVIAIALSGILLIILVVLFNNRKSLVNNNVSKEPEETVSETEVFDYYAWKNDETFFDSEDTSLANKLLEEMYTLDFKVTTVERDLHFEVLGYDGNLKDGIAFEIKVTGPDGKTETYENKDKNGYMIISGLKPGKYTVSLQPVSSYTVPDKPTEIEVKDTIEYLEISDIKYKLVSSKDVNRGLDDVMCVSASNSAEKKLYTGIDCFEDTNVTYGIDVDETYGDIDWSNVYESGVRFVMLRAGYRGASSGKLVIDDKLFEYARGAMISGLDVGVYFYSQATTVLEAVEEASAVLYLIDDLQIEAPVVIRLDSAGGLGRGDALPENLRTSIVKAFSETVLNAGYQAGVYAPKNWLITNVDALSIERFNVWMAEFAKTPTYEGYYDMWQYSDKGVIPGISKEVSLSIKYN